MERLTDERDTKTSMSPWDWCGLDRYCKRDCFEPTPCKIPAMARRLAEYEDTGLTPAEIEQMKTEREWVSVKDGFPNQTEKAESIYDPQTLTEIDVEYHAVSDLVIVCVLNDDGETFVCDDMLVDGKWVNFPFPEWEVTHWIKLPAKPE
jgi:hypothetical protein